MERNIKAKPATKGTRASGPAGTKPHLVGGKCRLCGYVSFPARPACPFCVRDGTMDEIPLSTRGRVNTFSISHVAPPGFKPPYVQAYVDLPDGPRIFSLIKAQGTSLPALDIGTEVELVTGTVRIDESGNEIAGYLFQVVPGARGRATASRRHAP